MARLVGQTLGKYEIVEEIGRGGMATVYRAYQPSLNRSVAVKVLSEPLARDSSFRRRFDREAKAVAQLSHPNIVPIYDFGEEPTMDVAYIVAEYMDRGTLKQLLGQPLEPLVAVDIVAQIAEALDYAHRQGIVHRDVKPSNILLAKDGRPRLSDFGLVKMATSGTQLTQTGTSMGTPAYMSPEQGLGKELDGRSDIYSLGIVLYEMLTGRLPFQADTPLAVMHQHVYAVLPSPRTFNRRVSRRLERALRKALAKDPNQRFRTAREMADALRSAITGPAVPLSRRKQKPQHVLAVPDETPAHLARSGISVNESRSALIGRAVGQRAMRVGRGLGKLLLRFAAWLLQTVLILALALLALTTVLVVASSFALASVAERGIASYPWGFEYLDTEHANVIALSDVQEQIDEYVVPYTLGIVSDLEVSLDTPDQVRVEAVVQGRTLTLDATLTEEEGAPRVDLGRLNRLPLSFAGRIVSRGINRGLRSVVEEAGVRFEEVRVERNRVIIIAQEKR